MTDLPDIPARRKFDWRTLIENVGPLLALAVLVVATILAEHAMRAESVFLKPENLLNILKQNASIGIVAIGMTLVIISGGIDLSVGSLVAMAGGFGIWVMNIALNAGAYAAENASALKEYQDNVAAGLNLPLELPHSAAQMFFADLFLRLHLAGSEPAGVAIAFVTMILVATLGGWLAGMLIARGRIAPFIATLGLLAIYRSLAMYVVDGAEYRSASPELFRKIGTGGIALASEGTTTRLLPWSGFVLLAFAIFAAYLLNKTRFGRYLYATGSNERAAVYSAISVPRVKVWVYVLMGAACGVAAILLASRLNSIASSSSGQLYELDAIAAVVIGGTRLSGGSGTIRGTIIGVLMLGVINNMLGILNVSPHLQGAVKGSIIVAAALLQQVGRKE